MKKIFFWIKNKIRVAIFYLILATSNLEIQIFRSVGKKSRMSGGIITKMLFRSRLLEKFFQGKYDEQYTQKFYELLKKSDLFIKNSSPHKIGATADLHTPNYGKKDKYGRRYEHYGFFDEKHKHHGKTLSEVLEIELEERRTKDDNYKILEIINNKPIEVGLSQITDVVKEIKKKDGKKEYIVVDTIEKSKKFKFPIMVARDNQKCVNKIEHLTEFLHIKKIAFEFRRFEFFIPLKFKTMDFSDDTSVIKDILNIKEFYIKNDYGELTGYAVKKFIERFEHASYEVFRFEGIEMKKIEEL